MLKKFSAVLITAAMALSAFYPAYAAASDKTDSTSNSIPTRGGEVSVTELTTFNFSPNSTGFWMISTFDNEECDPYLTLYSDDGENIAYDDDSGSDGNARIIVYLERGMEYVIEADFYDNSGEYGLLTQKIKPATLDGDVAQVTALSLFEITPERNGMWIFSTSDNGGSDPVLWLYENSELLSNNDDVDSYGDDMNSMISAYLTEGVKYTVIADYYVFEESQTYMLSAVESPLIEIDSGETTVNAETYFIFTPDKSFLWDIRTFNSDDDPTLMILNENGETLAYNDDGDEELNAAILIYLEENENYIIHTDFYYDDGGSCGLRIAQAEPTELSGEGGVKYVDASAGFLFVPENSGLWEISAVKITNSYPSLRVFDSEGQTIASFGIDEGDISVLINFEKGEEYLILTELANKWDSYNLRITDTKAEELPQAGGKVSVEKEAYYAFTPETSGKWEFSTDQNGDSDPYIWLYDAEGFLIAENDDKADNFNALITEELTAGETYIIRAGFYEGSGGYGLNVSNVK